MKIVFVSHAFPPAEKAGVPKYIWALAEGLAERNHECSVLCGSRRGLPAIEPQQVTVLRSRLDAPSFLKKLPLICRAYHPLQINLFERHCCECTKYFQKGNKNLVINGHTWTHGGKQALKLSEILSVPSVITLHGWQLDEFSMNNPPGYFPTLSKATAIVCQKNSAKEKLVQWGYPRNRIYVSIGPVIHSESLDTVKREQKSKTPLICFVGRFISMKRPSLLLSALPHILKVVPEAKAMFLGDGPLLGELKAEAARLNVTDSVVFCGWVDDVQKMLQKASVFVVTSPYHNSTDLSLLEAMAWGVPVVATESNGIRDVIKTGVNGFVCQNNKRSLAEKVIDCLISPDLTVMLGRNAKDYIKETATLESVVNTYEKIYEIVISD